MASLAQVVVGRLIDRVPLKRLFLGIVLMQIPLFALAAYAQGWALYAFALGFMVFVFGAIPFTDALIVRYVDDRMRSRVAGLRLATSFGISALAVYLLGPVVKASGFDFLLVLLAGHRDVLGDRDPRAARAVAAQGARRPSTRRD